MKGMKGAGEGWGEIEREGILGGGWWSDAWESVSDFKIARNYETTIKIKESEKNKIK